LLFRVPFALAFTYSNEALLTQRNLEEAARTVGIDPNTLLRWLKIPEFQVAYR